MLTVILGGGGGGGEGHAIGGSGDMLTQKILRSFTP